ARSPRGSRGRVRRGGGHPRRRTDALRCRRAHAGALAGRARERGMSSREQREQRDPGKARDQRGQRDPMTTRAHDGRQELWALAALSASLLAIRLYAATRVGFGDSEALYAAYAVHPQPAYLDPPPLIGLVARALGGGTAPSPERAHLMTAVLASLVPWAMALACRGAGASWRRAFAAALVFAVVPEIAIGLFAMT